MIPGSRAALAASVLAATLVASGARAEAVQTAAIPDGSGFSPPLTAATLELPASWRYQGGVNWNRATNCVNNKVRFEWRARSRDDLQGLEIMPGYNWQVQGTQIPMNPCPVQPFRSTRAFLEAVVQQRRAGARVLQYRDRPDIVEARRAQAAAAGSPASNARIDAGEVLIGYVSDGVECREVLATTVDFTEVRGNIMGGSRMLFAHRAPNGKLDFAFGEQLMRSFRYDKAWAEQTIAALRDAEHRFSSGQSQAIAQWHAKEMARINAEGAADRAAIRAAARNDVAKIYSDVNADTQRTNDVMHRRSLEAVGEYNTYRAPDGGNVRSSIHGGQRVLQTQPGVFMSTNDPYFNPAGSQELQRVR